MSAPLRCPQCRAAVLTTTTLAGDAQRCWCSSSTCGWRDTLPTAVVALSALLAEAFAPEPDEDEGAEPPCLADR